MFNSNYQLLIEKLDEFIRKYYKNQLMRGVIYSATIVLLFYITITVLEYYAHFDTTVRTILFYLFALTNIFIFGKHILIPLLKLNKLGKIISHEQAAAIIGKHFSEVNDKLLNVLQLKEVEQATSSHASSVSLVQASIEQKIREIKPVPFSLAIDLSQNKKHLKYLLIPVLLLGFIFFSSPAIIKDGTKRLVEHNTYFEKQAPFQFIIKNNSLQTVQQEDFKLEVKLTGDEIPEHVSIEIEDNEYSLNKENIVSFNYLFKNVQKNIHFRFSADGFTSKEYELIALPNPTLLNFDISLNYPKYIGKKDEVVKNTGDLLIPAGTKVAWTFNTRNTNVLRMGFGDSSFAVKPINENLYAYATRLFSNKNYFITTANDFLKGKDSASYSINVIPDMYPSIEVEEQKDSLSSKRFHFMGNIKDDYGFKKLSFNYRFIHREDSLSNNQEVANQKAERILPLNTSLTQTPFFYSWDMSELGVVAGDQIEYYFEVWDNDGVNGSKSTRSQTKLFKAPTLKEITENAEKNNTELKNDIQESVKQAKDIQKELNDLNKKVLEKKTLSWEEKKKLQDLLNKQKDLQQKVENIKKENASNNNEQSEYKKTNENIVEKQKQLEKLFENVMTDEMKEKFKELEKLLDKLDKDKVQQAIENMKMDNKDIEKELDRTLEIFKQLEFQEKLTETIEKLDDLAKKENEQSNKSSEKNADNKQLNEKQNELNKEFDDIKKDIDALEKKNNELERPNNIEQTDKQQEEIQQEMNKSSEQLQNNKSKKASQSQKNAAQKMQELSKQFSKMKSEMEQESNSEDMNSLRDILENLVHLSFDQEALMGELSKTRTDNPQYLKLTKKQKKLQDDSKMIEDSLLALSKRVPAIESTVNREINAINMNMEKAIDAMAERQVSEAESRQQFSMTSINNLALLLNEALQQMQQQMKNQMPGQGSCNKPGGKGAKPSMSDLRKMQEQLNQQLEKLKEGMGKEGKGKDGKKHGNSEGNKMSEELAKLAAQQAAIRQQLQQAAEQLNKNGKGGGNLGKLSEKMEETETDIVNKMISQETIKRQQEILTRLLESEKAGKEREMEEKRQSNEAKNENYSNPNQFIEYNRLKLKEAELLKTVPPSLIPFYKNKVNQYFNNFED